MSQVKSMRGKSFVHDFFSEREIGMLFDQAQNLTALRSMENYVKESETPREYFNFQYFHAAHSFSFYLLVPQFDRRSAVRTKVVHSRDENEYGNTNSIRTKGLPLPFKLIQE